MDKPLGVDLDPEVVDETGGETLWEGFLEEESVCFESVPDDVLRAFLRFQNLENVFSLARTLTEHASRALQEADPIGPTPDPDWDAYARLMDCESSRRGRTEENLEASQRALSRWTDAFLRRTDRPMNGSWPARICACSM